jgi:hypothetical protein
MKYAVEIGSGYMTWEPSFVKIGSGIQTLVGDKQTHIEHGDLISLLLFFQNKESRLKSRLMESSCYLYVCIPIYQLLNA